MTTVAQFYRSFQREGRAKLSGWQHDPTGDHMDVWLAQPDANISVYAVCYRSWETVHWLEGHLPIHRAEVLARKYADSWGTSSRMRRNWKQTHAT